jgi:hypothetical protein
MVELQTILGTDIPVETRSILYLCKLRRGATGNKLVVVGELFFNSKFEGLEAYANIPNPESQLITGNNFDDLIRNLHTQHSLFEKEEWLEQLIESI